MRIGHIQSVAGYAGRLAAAQDTLGHTTLILSRRTPPYNFTTDVFLSDFKPLALAKIYRRLRRWEPDVIHVHGGLRLMDVALVVLARLRGARLVVHYHGRETRLRNGLHWQRFIDQQFYTPPDLKPYLTYKAIWLPQPIDLQAILPEPAPKKRKPLFVHFSTSEENKGTRAVIDMFKQAFRADLIDGGSHDLVFDGDDARLVVYFEIPPSEVLDAMRAADVVIDQIAPSYGIYGYISVEAMALGRPVLATLDRGLYPPDCPVIYPRATKLMELAKDSEARRWYGARGREYVERVHDARKVAKKALNAYISRSESF